MPGREGARGRKGLQRGHGVEAGCRPAGSARASLLLPGPTAARLAAAPAPAADGTVPFLSGERIAFSYLTSQKFTGDVVTLDVLRDGAPKHLDVKARALPVAGLALPCSVCLELAAAWSALPLLGWALRAPRPNPNPSDTVHALHPACTLPQLMRPSPLVQHHLAGGDPSYLVVAGLVFTVVTGAARCGHSSGQQRQWQRRS